MFFFLIGGVEQQVRRVIKQSAGSCIACGSKADLVEYDKVLKLFFVPVWKWPSKHPAAMYCNSCHLFFPPSPRSCPSCDRSLHPDFRFCPFCGSSL